jgi:2-iminobutanoate/2-iminopropanoate deaminase
MTCSTKEVVVSEKAPKAIGPYSPAVRAGQFVFVSGQLGLDPVSGDLVEGGVEMETRQALTNLGSILEAAGTAYSHVVKTTVFLRDINDFAQMNRVYGQFFQEQPPARSAFQVAALPKGAAVEIEAIALRPASVDDGCSEGEMHD